MLIYRIVHINNLEYILQQKALFCPNHDQYDPGYTQIGNNSIIARRYSKSIKEVGGLSFQDFVAFYFGPRSIMLYNIKTGYNVPQVEQQNIIYFVYDVSRIAADGYEYFFTDGNGTQIPITRVFTDLQDIGEIDMNAAYATDFSATANQDDPDIKRRKHAEFHIKGEVQLNHLHSIGVYNQQAYDYVQGLCSKYKATIQTDIDQSLYF